MKKHGFLMISLVAIVFLAVLTACSASPSASKNIVNIKGSAFSPTEITIKQGDTVTWTNNDSVGHTIVGTTFTSVLLDTGQSFTQVFSVAGTFEYHCSVHPGMLGKVIVKSSGGY